MHSYAGGLLNGGLGEGGRDPFLLRENLFKKDNYHKFTVLPRGKGPDKITWAESDLFKTRRKIPLAQREREQRSKKTAGESGGFFSFLYISAIYNILFLSSFALLSFGRGNRALSDGGRDHVSRLPGAGSTSPVRCSGVECWDSGDRAALSADLRGLIVISGPAPESVPVAGTASPARATCNLSCFHRCSRSVFFDRKTIGFS